MTIPTLLPTLQDGLTKKNQIVFTEYLPLSKIQNAIKAGRLIQV